MPKGNSFLKNMARSLTSRFPVLGAFGENNLGNIPSIPLNPAQNVVKPARKWHGTIGIIGLDPTKVVTLNKNIVEYGNKIGLTDDQEFPEIISIGIKSNKAWYLEDQANLCNDFGCDVVAVAGDIGDNKESILRKRLEVAAHPMPLLSLHKQNFMRLAQESFEQACNIEKSRRPDLLYLENGGDFKNEIPKIDANIERDQINRGKRINERYQYGGGYPFLKNVPFAGIIGGGGPLASADLCEKLAATSTPFIHYSVNSAPGKYRFEMGNGPSFVNHYKNAVNLFDNLGAEHLLVPCNTAHKRVKEFCGDSISKIIDIRASVLEANENAEGFILLGTSMTTGVGMPEGEIGTYEMIRKNHPKHGPFNVPSLEQQKTIMEAIYDVKAGNLVTAKEKILTVVQEMRQTYGELPVILACTELPLANFEPLELVGLNFVDPANALTSRAVDLLGAAKAALILANKTKIDDDRPGKNPKYASGTQVNNVETDHSITPL